MGVEVSHYDGVVVILMVEEMGDFGGIGRGAGGGWRDVDVVKSVCGGVESGGDGLVFYCHVTWEMDV